MSAVGDRYGASARGAKPVANKIFIKKKKACFGSDGGGPDLRPVATIDADAPATQHKCCNMPAAAAAAYEL